MIEQILFWLFGLGAVASSLAMISRRMPVHSAVAFLGTLVSLAGLFFLLLAPFVAVLQIIIYAGAILVLFLFVIMLLHAHSGEAPVLKLKLQRPVAVVLSLALLAGLVTALVQTRWSPPAPPSTEGFGTAHAVGTSLFRQFLLPFEVASIVLLVGILGAVVLGRQEPRPPVPPEEPKASEAEPKEEVRV